MSIAKEKWPYFGHMTVATQKWPWSTLIAYFCRHRMLDGLLHVTINTPRGMSDPLWTPKSDVWNLKDGLRIFEDKNVYNLTSLRFDILYHSLSLTFPRHILPPGSLSYSCLHFIPSSPTPHSRLNFTKCAFKETSNNKL